VIFAQAHPHAKQTHHIREKDLDDVLQISNVFTNVSKGEVAKSNDLKKSFGTDDRNTIAREVSREQLSLSFFPNFCFSYFHRSSVKARFRSAKRSENTISRPSDAKSLH
jgi:hypothetical protein